MYIFLWSLFHFACSYQNIVIFSSFSLFIGKSGEDMLFYTIRFQQRVDTYFYALSPHFPKEVKPHGRCPEPVKRKSEYV